jgi:hypothetical protein
MLLALAMLIASAQAEPLTIRTEDCRALTRHVPAKDVEYKAGVDVRGRKVAPADLDSGYPNMVPDEVTLDIGIDLADRLGRRRAREVARPPITANRPLLPYTATASIGKLTVRGNDVFWNDQPLQPQEQAALATACRSAGAAADPPPPKPEPPTR